MFLASKFWLTCVSLHVLAVELSYSDDREKPAIENTRLPGKYFVNDAN